MQVIRPIADSDLDTLVELAGATTFGLTTLRMDRDQLAHRISDSLHAFETLAGQPRGESYLFVLEDTDSGSVIGTSAIVSKVGGFEPFYAYQIESSVHASELLNVRKQVPTLHLVAEHNGPCEIGSLFLSPDHRGGGRGRLLSLSRFLFMADHREYFDPQVIAEMRGVIDEHGHSPFWEAIAPRSMKGVPSRVPFLMMRMRAVFCSQTNMREVSPGGEQRYRGEERPLAISTTLRFWAVAEPEKLLRARAPMRGSDFQFIGR